jgi:hypothetical protein
MEPAVLGRMCAGGDYYETVDMLGFQRQEYALLGNNELALDNMLTGTAFFPS